MYQKGGRGKMKIIDMHCDTLLECYLKEYGLRKKSGHIDLESMKSAGALAQFFAIFIPWQKEAEEYGIELMPYELFQEIYKLYQRELKANGDMIIPALSYEDILKNEKAGKMSSILSIEDGQLLDSKIGRLDELHNKGVRLMTLLWNHENCIGFPNSSDAKLHQKGLKPFGIDAVEAMNDIGIIVDVSHLSEGGFYDVAKHSKKPFVASHSCARTMCDHQRNLTDDQLRCIANAGGVVGVNFYSKFLKANSDFTKVEDIMEHIHYMMNMMGSESIALGSDFDGISCGLEMDGYGQYDKLISQIEKKYSADIVEKICYENILRVIKECL